MTREEEAGEAALIVWKERVQDWLQILAFPFAGWPQANQVFSFVKCVLDLFLCG